MKELNEKELKAIEGGFLAILLVIAVGFVGGYLFGRQLAERGA